MLFLNEKFIFKIDWIDKDHAFMPRKFIVRWEEPLTKLVDEYRHSVSYLADHSTSFGIVKGAEAQRQ